MRFNDMTQIFKKYENQWIAMTAKYRVIASGKSLDEVLKKSYKKGYENPVTAKIPDSKYEFVL